MEANTSRRYATRGSGPLSSININTASYTTDQGRKRLREDPAVVPPAFFAPVPTNRIVTRGVAKKAAATFSAASTSSSSSSTSNDDDDDDSSAGSSSGPLTAEASALQTKHHGSFAVASHRGTLTGARHPGISSGACSSSANDATFVFAPATANAGLATGAHATRSLIDLGTAASSGTNGMTSAIVGMVLDDRDRTSPLVLAPPAFNAAFSSTGLPPNNASVPAPITQQVNGHVIPTASFQGQPPPPQQQQKQQHQQHQSFMHESAPPVKTRRAAVGGTLDAGVASKPSDPLAPEDRPLLPLQPSSSSIQNQAWPQPSENINQNNATSKSKGGFDASSSKCVAVDTVVKPLDLNEQAVSYSGPSTPRINFDLPNLTGPDTGSARFWQSYSENVQDVWKRRETDVGLLAPYGYMRFQIDINDRMRAILIDWLVEVHLKFKLLPETLFLTVNLIDRFLSRRCVARTKLQLVGVTAMLLASKREEMYPPEVRDFVYITDSAYTADQIFSLEEEMLEALEFRLEAPTCYSFIPRLLRSVGVDERSREGRLTAFLSERMLQEYGLLRFPPSKTAAAALNIALRTIRGPFAWNEQVESASGFRQADLRDLASEIKATVEVSSDLSSAQSSTNAVAPTTSAGALVLRAVQKKYSAVRYCEVSSLQLASFAE